MSSAGAFIAEIRFDSHTDSFKCKRLLVTHSLQFSLALCKVCNKGEEWLCQLYQNV